jgi:hypothetical protein
MPRIVALLGCLVIAASVPAAAQAPAVLGTWKFDIKQGKKDGPRVVVVRPDSSASYGTETVRWRIKPDSLLLALGGEWVSYRLKVGKERLTLSGGDLNEPVDFDRVGPPTPRPDSIPVPADPDKTPS